MPARPGDPTLPPAIRQRLTDWYRSVARDLPWRRTRDPYRIWLSEVMLQQTRVDQALPYYERFTTAYPTLHHLAAAPLDEVLRRWEGLGYYARAHHLHRAAQQVVSDCGGQLPTTWAALRRLPGVGDYTAAAVLSIAFNQPHAVLDGNVARVLARVFTLDDDVKAPRTRKRLQALADHLLDTTQPGTFNQAMMELGATVCTPTSPQCPRCPLQPCCCAFAAGTPEQWPVSRKKAPLPHYHIAVGLVSDETGALLIQRRPEDGLLGGLWEFPGGKQLPGEPLAETCRRELREELGIDVVVLAPLMTLSHAYTHFRITLHAFRCRLAAGTPQAANGQPLRWVALSDLDQYAFPRANRRLIERLHHPQPTLFDRAAEGP